VYNKEFKWTIVIPADFQNVSAADWAKMKDKGAEAIENTYGEEIVDATTTLFVFKNADFNYLEANAQPYDVNEDGNYLDNCKNVNEIIYETFRTQLAGASIDSLTSVTEISGLEFQTFTMKLDLPNGITMHSSMYSRLFDDQEFSVNIMYVDEAQGEKMNTAWARSIFE